MSPNLAVPHPGTDAATLVLQWDFADGVLRRNIEGVEADDARKGPPRGGNGMHWILAHLLGARNGALGLLGEAPEGDPARLAPFARGATATSADFDALPWEESCAAMATAHGRLRAALERVPVEALAAPLPEDRNPFGVASVGQMLAALVFHESYHVGQLGLLRRTLGRAGAIR